LPKMPKIKEALRSISFLKIDRIPNIDLKGTIFDDEDAN
jgi:hypothetical protein